MNVEKNPATQHTKKPFDSKRFDSIQFKKGRTKWTNGIEQKIEHQFQSD